MTARLSARLRTVLLGCGIAALTACGGTTATDTVTAPSRTTSITVTRAVGVTTTATTTGGTAVASGSAVSGRTIGAARAGTSIATNPAVGVSASGVGRLEVTLMGTFEAAYDYRIAGSGLMPGSQIDYVGQLGQRKYGPVAQDGTYSMRQYSVAKDADYGTLSATARDGAKVTTQFRVACSPLGEGFG